MEDREYEGKKMHLFLIGGIGIEENSERNNSGKCRR
jgi:hypothetical protein